jgi:filamentous hemagglutinin
MVNGLPQFSAAAYTITAVDNPANPSIYYAVNLTNSSSGPAPTLPAALFGNSLTTKAGDISINTAVALPGGAFNATANKGGNISVGSRGIVDVSGQAMTFVDVLATIGGGNINLTSTGGAISIVSGAVLNVGDLADVGAPNQNAAGTLTLAAPIGGVAIAAGALHGEGVDAASSGSFVLDTNSLSTSAPQNYDAIASLLIAGGFGKSWNIRARTGDIDMTGLTQAQNVTVSADTGQIDISGTIDAHGPTPGQINLWAGTDLILEASAVLNARGDTADANGRGGQVLLAASQEGNQMGTLTLNVGATIDVTAVAANSIDTGPVLGGQVTFMTSRNAANNNVMLTVNGGTFAQFLSGANGQNGVIGESAWDGIVIVGNQTYSYNVPTLIVTPSTTVASNGTTQTVAFTSFLNHATAFMGGNTASNQSTIWSALGADGNGVANGTFNSTKGLYTSGVLVNIRPGITIKNSGAITVKGDSTNPNGVDLSGSAYPGSALNTGDRYSLDGHFVQYDEPVVLGLRASGNLNSAPARAARRRAMLRT